MYTVSPIKQESKNIFISFRFFQKRFNFSLLSNPKTFVDVLFGKFAFIQVERVPWRTIEEDFVVGAIDDVVKMNWNAT